MGFYVKEEPAHLATEKAAARTLSRARKPQPRNAWPPILTVGIGHRFYNPGLGRWVSRDPIGELGGLSMYGFCNNMPVQTYDLNGEMFEYAPIIGAIEMAIKTWLAKFPGMKEGDYKEAAGDGGVGCFDRVQVQATKYTIDLMAPNIVRYAEDLAMDIVAIIPHPIAKFIGVVGIVGTIADATVTMWGADKIKAAASDAKRAYCKCDDENISRYSGGHAP